ncbi:hypothetical protein [Rummeliibacillus stabekisii]|uniref:hypothetical protein n=1 Tax=Rummeliibacillus stabekisii TaxID=241244 RepID=UPI0011688231|nr:hypothetical protein [Rummeliibacillus stabekisii]MBB5171766.1 hypothetical protein [Rummeliibacillus stabekisii]GEL06485.1 hypothetical protein RST01_31120 [Rummeliibacillus stabekisii]
MIEKYEVEVILDVYRGEQEDLENIVVEMKAYQKEYENDLVTVLEIKELPIIQTDKRQYIIILQVERDTNNLGRIYESEEEKLFGFDEEE